MMPLLFINDDLWQEARLRSDDIPATWQDLRDVARTLTRYDSRGRIMVAGLSLEIQEWLQNAAYQQGRYLFTADGRQLQVDTPEYLGALRFIHRLVHHDRVVDYPIAIERQSAFAAGQAAMYVGYSWVAGVLRDTVPHLQWSVHPVPTPAGTLLPAYGSKRYAVEAVVNAHADPHIREVAWDFWHYTFSREQTLLEDLALFNGFVPAYRPLKSHERVLADPVISVMLDLEEHSIAQDLPAGIRQAQFDLVSEVMLTPDDPAELLSTAGRRQNDIMSDYPDWPVTERRSPVAGRMLPDQ